MSPELSAEHVELVKRLQAPRPQKTLEEMRGFSSERLKECLEVPALQRAVRKAIHDLCHDGGEEEALSLLAVEGFKALQATPEVQKGLGLRFRDALEGEGKTSQVIEHAKEKARRFGLSEEQIRQSAAEGMVACITEGSMDPQRALAIRDAFSVPQALVYDCLKKDYPSYLRNLAQAAWQERSLENDDQKRAAFVDLVRFIHPEQGKSAVKTMLSERLCKGGDSVTQDCRTIMERHGLTPQAAAQTFDDFFKGQFRGTEEQLQQSLESASDEDVSAFLASLEEFEQTLIRLGMEPFSQCLPRLRQLKENCLERLKPHERKAKEGLALVERLEGIFESLGRGDSAQAALADLRTMLEKGPKESETAS